MTNKVAPICLPCVSGVAQWSMDAAGERPLLLDTVATNSLKERAGAVHDARGQRQRRAEIHLLAPTHLLYADKLALEVVLVLQ